MEHLDALKARLDRLRPLTVEQVALLWPMWSKQDVLFTYASNAIEGSTLTLGETEVVVAGGVTIGGKPLQDHLDAVNGVRAYRLMLHLAQQENAITGNTLLVLHEALFPNSDFGGRLRDHAVYISGAVFVPPEYEIVPSYLYRTFDSYRAALATEHPVAAGSVLASRLTAIHPFADGNGRVTRLLTNLHLIVQGYPPVLIDPEKDKAPYLDALRAASNRENVFDCDPSPFVSYMATMEERSFSYYVRALEIAHGTEVAEKAKHVES